MPATRKERLVFVRKEKDFCGKSIKVYKNKEGVLFAKTKIDDNTLYTYKYPASYLAKTMHKLIDGCGPIHSCGRKCRKRLAKTKKSKK